MKGYSIKLVMLYACLTLFAGSLLNCQQQNNGIKEPANHPDSVAVKLDSRYAGSFDKGNYVWGGAMNLCWNELSGNIVHAKIKLATTDTTALITEAKLNNPVLAKQDLDAASYYIKSGYGPQTQTIINRESRLKFPSKSFADLNYQLKPNDIISYAYFIKVVKYLNEFYKQDILFENKSVKGFEADKNSFDNIYILDYQNPDKFLIGIKLKDSKDQIFLAKGYPMDQPDGVVAFLRSKVQAQTSDNYNLGKAIDHRDVFQAPILHLDYVRDYKEMLRKVLENKIQNREYQIAVMNEKIKFDMDEKGARVENEAVIILEETMAPPKPSTYVPKIMKLDKPYWVVMKRYDSNNPYFILGVKNTELMHISKVFRGSE